MYLDALDAHCKLVSTHLGTFKEGRKQCPLCHRKYRTHEEKETDVAMGAHLVNDLYRKNHDLIIEWKQARRFTLELFRSAPSDPQSLYEDALQQLQSHASQRFGEATLLYMLQEEDLERRMRDEE